MKVLLFMFVAVALIFGPLVTILALNILFPSLGIPYNFATWFACLWLCGLINQNKIKK